jgi:Flp pilus assembly secretin CpaC
MRLIASAIASIAAFLALASAAMADPLAVQIDGSTRITLPAAARDVIVGNPSIADVAVLDGRNILVLGKSYGVTSLMVTDQRGRTILNTQVVVSANDVGRVSLFRGPELQSYACAPRCERTAAPGSAGGAAPAGGAAASASAPSP